MPSYLTPFAGFRRNTERRAPSGGSTGHFRPGGPRRGPRRIHPFHGPPRTPLCDTRIRVPTMLRLRGLVALRPIQQSTQISCPFIFSIFLLLSILDLELYTRASHFQLPTSQIL